MKNSYYVQSQLQINNTFSVVALNETNTYLCVHVCFRSCHAMLPGVMRWCVMLYNSSPVYIQLLGKV